VAEPDRDKVMGQALLFLQALGRSKGRTTFNQDGHRTFALTGKGLVGEYTVIDGDVMHLTGVRYSRKRRKKAQEWVRYRPHPAPTRADLEREAAAGFSALFKGKSRK
jgi:hypothetical protein